MILFGLKRNRTGRVQSIHGHPARGHADPAGLNFSLCRQSGCLSLSVGRFNRESCEHIADPELFHGLLFEWRH